jgi:hypothetical protein
MPQPRIPPRAPKKQPGQEDEDLEDGLDDELDVGSRRRGRLRGRLRGAGVRSQRGRSPEDEDLDEDDIDLGGGRGLEYYDDDPQDIFGSDQTYNQAVSKGQYIRVHFIKPLIKHIDETTLFPDTKETLKIIVHGFFDKTEVLARTTNLRLEEIEAQIIMAQARIGFHPSDVDNPDLNNICNLILKLYRRFISRSLNGWERELDNRIETSSTVHHSDDRYSGMAAAQQQKAAYPIWHPRRWI